MGKHHEPKQRRARKAALAGAAAAGVSGALVLGTATGATVDYDVNLAANTIIGVGGRDDPNADRVESKLSGDYAFGFTGNYARVVYPANVLFQSSVDRGTLALKDQVDLARDPEDGDPDGKIRVVSFSEGTLVAEQVKRDYAADGYPVSPDQLDFVFMASPYSPNGGIFARFPGFRIPGLLPEFSAAQPTEYHSIYVTNEYDGFADFPAYFNPVSLANALAGMAYAHPDEYYDEIDLDQLVEGEGKFTTTVGTDTYVFVRNPELPLLAPIRQIAALTGLKPLTDPVLGAVEPLLRVAVDAGYTDRTNATPGTPTPFSLITPPAKIVEAATKVPDAVQEGADNVTGGQPQPNTADREAAPAGGDRATVSTADEDTDSSGQPTKKPKKPVTEKTAKNDPFQAVSSAIKKGLAATLAAPGDREAKTAEKDPAESKKANPPADKDPKSNADAA